MNKILFLTSVETIHCSCCTGWWILLYNPHSSGSSTQMHSKEVFQGFPGGTMVKNPPANAGDMGSSPGLEYPTCRRATKPMCHNYWACALEPVNHNYWSPCATTIEACAPRGHAPQQDKPPLTATRESPHAATKTQCNQK